MSAEPLSSLAASFRLAVQAEGRSAATIRLHQQSIRLYCDWLATQGLPADLDHLTRQLVRTWVAELAESRQPNTIRTRLLALTRFARFLAEEGIDDTNRLAGVVPPTAPDRPVPVFTDDDLAALLRVCSGKEFADRRDEAMLRLLLDTGIRVSELTGLTVDGVDINNRAALVTGKGKHIRPIYFGTKTARALDRYFRARRQHRYAELTALLLTQRGAMSADGVRERLNVIGAAAGVPDVHPHRFRHTFAHDYLLAGGQQVDLRRLAGWTSDAMLARYGAAGADLRAREAAQRLARGDRV